MVADYAGSSKIEVKTMCQLAELVISNR